jgi:GT2 family glycosyltransferase
MAASPPVGIVIATRNRRESLLRTLRQLAVVAEGARVAVVDNGSGDDTVGAVCSAHPDVTVIALGENLGAAARNAGARALDIPYVAFSDDDSWWARGALAIAARAFEEHPRVALLAGRVLVGSERRLDPTCELMRDSPLRREDDLPGPSVLGFIACGAVVRRSAFLEVGGFDSRFGIGGEEQMLALDLAAAGWGLAYLDRVVARHFPDPGERPGRSAVVLRNRLWVAWLRRPLRSALRETARVAAGDGAMPGLARAVAGLPWVLAERRVVPDEVERAAALLDA